MSLVPGAAAFGSGIRVVGNPVARALSVVAGGAHGSPGRGGSGSRSGGLWIGREARSGLNLGIDRGAYDWPAARDALSSQLDGSRHTILHTDDGVAWRHVVAAIDLLLATGYDTPQLAGGPAGP